MCPLEGIRVLDLSRALPSSKTSGLPISTSVVVAAGGETGTRAAGLIA